VQAYIFSLTDLTWRAGPPLPEEIDEIASIQLEDGFLAIGGYDTEYLSSKAIFKFSQDTYEWTKQEEQLERGRENAIYITVPDDFVDCQ